MALSTGRKLVAEVLRAPLHKKVVSRQHGLSLILPNPPIQCRLSMGQVVEFSASADSNTNHTAPSSRASAPAGPTPGAGGAAGAGAQAAAAGGAAAAAGAGGAGPGGGGGGAGGQQGGPAAFFEDPRATVLQAALDQVGALGWTDAALAAGARAAGFPGLANGMFPAGPVELAHHVMDEAAEHMQREVTKMTGGYGMELDGFQVAEVAVLARLDRLARVRSRWPEAMALGLRPAHAGATADRLARLADEVCHLAGDKSADFSWYTRRAAVASVCVASELHMIVDSSEDLADTKAFVKRRISELKTLDKAPSLVSDFQLGVTSVLGALGTAVVSLAPKGPGLPDPGLLAAGLQAAGLQAVLQNLAAAAPAPPMGGSFGGPAAAAAEESSLAGEGPVFDGAPEEDPLAKKVDTTAARKNMKDTKCSV